MELRLYNFHRLISGFISSTLLDEPVGIPTPAPKSDSRAGSLETFLTPRPDGHFWSAGLQGLISEIAFLRAQCNAGLCNGLEYDAEVRDVFVKRFQEDDDIVDVD